MTEFILGIRQIKNSAEYSPSSLINCINLLSLYLLNHPDGNHQFTLSNKKEFRLLNGKLKQLKKSGTIVKHHDNLTDEEVQQIFQHSSISINDPQGLQYHGGLRFTKCSQKNDQGGIESDNTGLIIPVPPDPADFQGPIHDFKLHISKRPESPYLHLRINNKFAYDPEESWYCDQRLGEKLCQTFMKNICNVVIDTKNRSITNHSGRSTSITTLFRQGVPMVTT
ncbi:26272_t:CDS:2, partial [Gigaspora margarita]